MKDVSLRILGYGGDRGGLLGHGLGIEQYGQARVSRIAGRWSISGQLVARGDLGPLSIPLCSSGLFSCAKSCGEHGSACHIVFCLRLKIGVDAGTAGDEGGHCDGGNRRGLTRFGAAC